MTHDKRDQLIQLVPFPFIRCYYSLSYAGVWYQPVLPAHLTATLCKLSSLQSHTIPVASRDMEKAVFPLWRNGFRVFSLHPFKQGVRGSNPRRGTSPYPLCHKGYGVFYYPKAFPFFRRAQPKKLPTFRKIGYRRLQKVAHFFPPKTGLCQPIIPLSLNPSCRALPYASAPRAEHTLVAVSWARVLFW